jgi:predicted transposase YdaD
MEMYFKRQRELMDAYSEAHNHEYLIAEAEKKGKKEGRKEGKEEGRKEGKEEGRKEGKEEGRKEGKEEGRKEGKEEGVENVARSMLAEGISIATIIKCTGLAEKNILSLR